MSSTKIALKDQFHTLAQIQEIDLQILAAQKELGNFPQQLKEKEGKIAAAQKAHALIEQELETARSAVSASQVELQATRERLEISRGRLETVRNQGQFQAVHREIEQMERAEFMLKQLLDTRTQTLKQIEDRLAQAKNSVESAEQAKASLVTLVTEAGNGAAARVEVLERSKAPLKGNVEPRILSLYDRIRGSRAGIGVAAIVDGACKACHRSLPPQLLNELRKGENPQQCSNCQRLIYLP